MIEYIDESRYKCILMVDCIKLGGYFLKVKCDPLQMIGTSRNSRYFQWHEMLQPSLTFLERIINFIDSTIDSRIISIISYLWAGYLLHSLLYFFHVFAWLELSFFFHVRASFDESPRCGNVEGQIRAPLNETSRKRKGDRTDGTDVMKAKIEYVVYLAGTSFCLNLLFICSSQKSLIIYVWKRSKLTMFSFWNLEQFRISWGIEVIVHVGNLYPVGMLELRVWFHSGKFTISSG